MKYLLMIYGNEGAEAAAPQAAMVQMMSAYMAYSQALVQAGVMVGGERLKPSAMATRVRVAADKTEVLDGPYADSKEQLGGYYMIEVPDLDQALSWAARCPGAQYGVIEVRPVWPM